MKRTIKRVLHMLVGEARARAVLRKVRRGSVGFSEAELVYEFFLRKKAPGLMIDVGAHLGESVQPYLVKGWRALAFEPDPTNRAQLVQRIQFPNLILRSEAVGDREIDEMPFYASEESDGISSLSAFRPTHREVAHVKVTTLTKAMEMSSIQGVDFLKIDTEGHDYFVLKGFPWSDCRPQVVLCEFEDRKTKPLGYDYRDMGEFLVRQRYDVFLSEWHPIDRYGGSHKWRRMGRFPVELKHPDAWGNFIAFDRSACRKHLRRYCADFGIDPALFGANATQASADTRPTLPAT